MKRLFQPGELALEVAEIPAVPSFEPEALDPKCSIWQPDREKALE